MIRAFDHGISQSIKQGLAPIPHNRQYSLRQSSGRKPSPRTTPNDREIGKVVLSKRKRARDKLLRGHTISNELLSQSDSHSRQPSEIVFRNMWSARSSPPLLRRTFPCPPTLLGGSRRRSASAPRAAYRERSGWRWRRLSLAASARARPIRSVSRSPRRARRSRGSGSSSRCSCTGRVRPPSSHTVIRG